ncbi:MAG: GNAT family N-acetyltransferase [Candidatus Nanopelagicales bacterium]|jgi:GNAT superfamily N-acetyltransferase|nr:GNAT family N-acetyltransferase [Candidatus Nanopelagicales bacterium]
MVHVRPASREEVRPVQQRVLRPDGPLPSDRPHPADWLHFAAEVDGEVIGACSVGPSVWEHPQWMVLVAPQWQIRSMAVLPDHRGGVGSMLLHAAVTAARQAGAGGFWADARVAALGLYERAGWQVVGPEWVKPGVGPHRYVVLPPPTPR